MIVLLDTTTPVCKLTLVKGDQRYAYEWTADRDLARGLHAYLRDQLARHDQTITNISGIGVLRGPGSFTGLRIGMTVLNTLATSLKVPIVGATGETWQDQALARLEHGENDQLVMPEYGAEAHITIPRK